jgi:hypothetical protein
MFQLPSYSADLYLDEQLDTMQGAPAKVSSLE